MKILTCLLFSFVFSAGITPDYGPLEDWTVFVSSNSGSINFNQINIPDGEFVQTTSNQWYTCPDNNCDVIGVFYGDVCIGWSYRETVTVLFNDFVTPNTENYPSPASQIQFLEIRFFDSSMYIEYQTSITLSDVNNNCDNNSIICTSITTNVPEITFNNNSFGCTDEIACNYSPTAIFDDGTCAYYDCMGDCGGSYELDPIEGCCLTESMDECGICDGDNSYCTGCTYNNADNFAEVNLIDDGTCFFPECVGGDYDGNGTIDITDIVQIVQLILFGEE